MHKILHVLWQMGIGGAEKAVYQLVIRQNESGINADVLLGDRGGFYGNKLSEKNIKVYEMGKRFGWDYRFNKSFLQILRMYNIVHFHVADVPLVRSSILFKRIKKFYTHRAGNFNYNFKKKIGYRIAGYYFRNYFNGISGNTFHAGRVASKLFNIPLQKIYTTYNGIDFSLLNPNRTKIDVLNELNLVNKDKIIIGTSANLREWKRIDLLIKSLALLKSNNFICYILGDGDNREYCENLVFELGLENVIKLLGKKSDIENYLQIFDIFVLPSGPEESFGNSIVEAMGVGTPVIIFQDGGGLLEHVIDGETGFIVEDVRDLSLTIDVLSKNKNLRKRIGLNARKVIRGKYNLQKMIDNYNIFYSSF